LCVPYKGLLLILSGIVFYFAFVFNVPKFLILKERPIAALLSLSWLTFMDDKWLFLVIYKYSIFSTWFMLRCIPLTNGFVVSLILLWDYFGHYYNYWNKRSGVMVLRWVGRVIIFEDFICGLGGRCIFYFLITATIYQIRNHYKNKIRLYIRKDQFILSTISTNSENMILFFFEGSNLLFTLSIIPCVTIALSILGLKNSATNYFAFSKLSAPSSSVS